jgi:phosphate transport system substrate-binding protein
VAYPLSRFLFLYTNGEPQGDAKAFVDYLLSPEGQKIVEQVGYIPLN